jgi:hypothetical protein
MSYPPSLTIPSMGSIQSSEYSTNNSADHYISISPTTRYSGDFQNRSYFEFAIPLVTTCDHERRVLTVIEQPSIPITCGSTFYCTLDKPDFWFNLEDGCGVSRDCMMFYRKDGWIIAVPDRFYHKELGWKHRLQRFMCYICLPSFDTSDEGHPSA